MYKGDVATCQFEPSGSVTTHFYLPVMVDETGRSP
jgi:hypothetical protein